MRISVLRKNIIRNYSNINIKRKPNKTKVKIEGTQRTLGTYSIQFIKGERIQVQIPVHHVCERKW